MTLNPEGIRPYIPSAEPSDVPNTPITDRRHGIRCGGFTIIHSLPLLRAAIFLWMAGCYISALLSWSQITATMNSYIADLP